MAALFVAFLEGGSRLVRDFRGPENPVRGKLISILGEHDHLLFWKLKPNLSDELGCVSTNRLGLRAPEIGPKDPGEVRVLSLGESTTLAARLPYEESYSAVLERQLNASGQARYRVINAGVSGYSSFQGYQYLRHRGLELQPDVVLLYFGHNDLLRTAFLARRADEPDRGNAAAVDDWTLYRQRQRPLARLGAWLHEHSNLYRGIALLRGDHGGPQARVQQAKKPRVPPEHRRRILERFQELCRSRGIHLIVVIPIYSDFREHIPLLREVTGDLGIPVVDLPARLEGRLSESPRADFYDALHPRSHVHRMIAEEIHDVIRASATRR